MVIGSDQVAALGSQVLDKPGDRRPVPRPARRRQRLERPLPYGLRRDRCRWPASAWSHIDTTTVFFRSLSEQEIERYVERERPFDCAGGFRAEGLGISLFESIESRDPTAIIGLPLIWLACALRRAGFLLP